METKKSHNSPTIFDCELCHYTCSKHSDFVKHKLTRKHINNTIGDKKIAIKEFICEVCHKTYNSRNGLWKHNKICNVNNSDETDEQDEPEINKNILGIFIKENSDFKNLILEIVKNNTNLQKQNQDLQKQNQEFQEKMFEMCKNSNTTINNKNSHNKTFNMQIFLNEHCKDAMNIKDFADSFQLQISDFEKVGHLGYVDGISDIIIKKLNEMDVHKRPIHCSDTKRDIIYVHADNVWTKENSDHEQVRLLVQRITAKNIRLIPIWQDLYPNSRNNMHKLNDTYMSLTRQAMGGFGGTIPENETKIIKKIAKTVFIDKNM
jgi:hypothetical protein